jgi:antitoxin component HigA of HigAB toxin-antitoxin module
MNNIVTETEYQQALTEMRRLVEAEPDRRSPEGRRLDALAAVAETYEAHQSGPNLTDIDRR